MPEEFQEAVSALFENILRFRSGGRIEGQFAESDLENRVRQLEIGIEKANKLLDEIVEFLMNGK